MTIIIIIIIINTKYENKEKGNVRSIYIQNEKFQSYAKLKQTHYDSTEKK